jgi:hypothetical protein
MQEVATSCELSNTFILAPNTQIAESNFFAIRLSVSRSERAAHVEPFHAAATTLIGAGIRCCRNKCTRSMK